MILIQHEIFRKIKFDDFVISPSCSPSGRTDERIIVLPVYLNCRNRRGLNLPDNNFFQLCDSHPLYVIVIINRDITADCIIYRMERILFGENKGCQIIPQ